MKNATTTLAALTTEARERGMKISHLYAIPSADDSVVHISWGRSGEDATAYSITGADAQRCRDALDSKLMRDAAEALGLPDAEYDWDELRLWLKIAIKYGDVAG